MDCLCSEFLRLRLQMDDLEQALVHQLGVTEAKNQTIRYLRRILKSKDIEIAILKETTL